MATISSSADILRRVIRPEDGSMPTAMAEYLATLSFAEADLDRIDALSSKASAGTLVADERAELQSFIDMNNFLGLLRAKARQSLKVAGR